MADVIITLRIMPLGTDSDLEAIGSKAKVVIEKFGAHVAKVETEEVAFGLKALKLVFIMNESKGSTEPLEKSIKNINGVSSADVIDVRRAVG